MELVFQISNSHHRLGGLWWPLKLGTIPQIIKTQRHALAFEFFVLGTLFIMGLSHLGLYLLRRKEVSTFYLAYDLLSEHYEQ